MIAESDSFFHTGFAEFKGKKRLRAKSNLYAFLVIPVAFCIKSSRFLMNFDAARYENYS